MTMPDKIQNGSCLCGNVHYSFLQKNAISTHHCHCRDCQKSTGSGKATIVMIPDESLNLEGSLKFYTVTGTAGSHISRGFCDNCGSPVMSFIEENPGIKLIKAGTLDNSSWVSIASNFWGSSAAVWSPADEVIHTFTENPDFE
jgi:hypothetical protein|tara:strand:+ start:139 stop:567 length:429 start_codon:yes stop_codon:yes gene_type:complete